MKRENKAKLKKTIEQIFKSQKEWTKTLKHFQELFGNINRKYAALYEFKNTYFINLDILKTIIERLKEYNKMLPNDLLLVAQYGWFIDMESDLKLPLTVAYHFKNNNTDVANELMINYYKKNFDRIFEKLINRHHNRKVILKQIETSFRKGYYSILIPAALTQIDGICFDFTKKKFFIKEKDNKYLPQITRELEKSAGYYSDLYLSPLKNQTPIIAREQDVPKFPCHLNRHEIIHGINITYGTEINSLKVISLLKYISDLLSSLDNKNITDKTLKA